MIREIIKNYIAYQQGLEKHKDALESFCNVVASDCHAPFFCYPKDGMQEFIDKYLGDYSYDLLMDFIYNGEYKEIDDEKSETEEVETETISLIDGEPIIGADKTKYKRYTKTVYKEPITDVDEFIEILINNGYDKYSKNAYKNKGDMVNSFSGDYGIMVEQLSEVYDYLSQMPNRWDDDGDENLWRIIGRYLSDIGRHDHV